MTIDFTHPVETTEDPPRPVRVLATDLPDCFAPLGQALNQLRDVFGVTAQFVPE